MSLDLVETSSFKEMKRNDDNVDHDDHRHDDHHHDHHHDHHPVIKV